jgi:hypothetical protein
VRESGLVVETLKRIRVALPFALSALDVDNGSEFVNGTTIHPCLGRGIELTRSTHCLARFARGDEIG